MFSDIDESDLTAAAMGESAKRRAEPPMDDAPYFSYVDAHQETYVAQLAEVVAIPGVSAEPARRPDVERTVKWVQSWCDRLGAETRLERLGDQSPGLPLPPVLLASFGDPKADPSKPVLCVYGHLDVQPAYKTDGWDTEPFTLTEKDGVLFGRGASDDKGPVVAWLCAIEALQALGRELPVHLRCVFEGMEESGSVGLPDLVRSLAQPGGFLDASLIDYICISDNYYVGKRKPCLTHGLRGNVYFHVGVECSSKDMHSGVIGGSVHEGMTDLVKLMASLVDGDGTIRVAGIYDDVAEVSEREKRMTAAAAEEFDLEAYKVDIGVAGVTDALLHPTATEILNHRWRYPVLSLHGIEGAFGGEGSKTVIPRNVIAKFSIRIVPDMEPPKVERLVREHLEKEWASLKSPNRLTITVDKAGWPWYRQPDAPNFAAAAAATKRVHGIEPVLTREGGSIPITMVFEEACDATCVLLPIGASDDGAHSQNEKIDRRNFLNGIKLMGCYMGELRRLKQRGGGGGGSGFAAEAAAKRSRAASGAWRRRCKRDPTQYGCECLDCGPMD
jgi:nonspecific dipeptidase